MNLRPDSLDQMPDKLTMTMKRGIDIAVSALALFAMAPFMAFVAMLVKFNSHGPVLFKQERAGRGGVPFKILKFRSMVTRQPISASNVTVRNDPRITKLGAILRKTKIDELPQLINVLIGDMSLIGPRPEVLEYVRIYNENDRLIILGVRPGLSDFASIRFRNESDILAQQSDPLEYYKLRLLPCKLRYCRFYVRRISISTDILIGIWTVAAIMGWTPLVFRNGMTRRR